MMLQEQVELLIEQIIMVSGTDTSYQINRITLTFRDGGTGNVLTGTVMKVWGHD